MLKKWKLRLLLGIFVGVLIKLMVDVIFALIYRTQTIQFKIGDYVLIILSALIVIQLMYWISNSLDKRITWSDQTKKRFLIQLAYYQGLIFVAFGPIRWIIAYSIFDLRFTVVRDEIIILSTIIIVTLFILLSELSVFLIYKWRFSFAELERFKKENAEFKFETLQNQVNPHFLFNSLNTLSSLMYESIETASAYIRQLSMVYRYVLENRNNELISLQKELDFLEAYKYLFEIRFKERLSIELKLEELTEQWLIAPMTIQLLIENAVKHNIISKTKPLMINVIIKNDTLTVSNVLQRKEAEGFSAGLGLLNIKNRYEYLSKKAIIINESGDCFSVQVPLINKN